MLIGKEALLVQIVDLIPGNADNYTDYEARKEQWHRESDLLRAEVKYKAEQIATDLLGDVNKKLSK